MRTAKPRLATLLGPLALLVALVLVLVTPPLLAQPLARLVERSASQKLHGYRLTVGRAELDPLRLRVRLHDLALEATAIDQSPLLRAPVADISIQLAGFLRLRAGLLLRDAVLEADPARLRTALDAELGPQLVSLGREGVATLAHYRGALETVALEDAALRWVDVTGAVTLTDVSVRIENLSEPRPGGPDDRYALRVEARAAGSGTLKAEGTSQLFAPGTPATEMAFAVHELPLGAFSPLAERARLDLRGGAASARGRLQIARRSLSVAIDEATVHDADLDWRHTAATWAEEKRVLGAAARRAHALTQGWDVAIDVGRVTMQRSTLGIRDTEPPYRLFLAVERADARRLSSSGGSPPGTVALNGRLMGSGAFDVDATFRSAPQGPDFDLRIVTRDLSLPTLNDALHSRFGERFASGTFALDLEASVRNGRISGYVEPFLADAEVERREQPGLVRRLAEKAVNAASDVLANERGDIATRTTLSGTLRRPDVSVWEALIGVLQNAFVESIAPELEQVAGRR